MLEFCLFSLFKGLRQTNQNSAHKRRIVLCDRVHGFQPSLAGRPHGTLSLAGACAERLRHLGACLGSAARDFVKNRFPLPFNWVARALDSVLDAVEELFFEGLEFFETFLHARFLETRAAIG